MAENPRIEELRKRLEKEPGSRLFAQLGEELRKAGDFEEAIRVCREGLQKQPTYPSARMTLGRALFDTGDLAAARTEFESVLKAAADNILASRLLGECLEGLGDLSGALARYKTTLALAPGDKQVLGRIAEIEGKLKAPAPPTPSPPAAASTPEAASAVAQAEPPPIKVVEAEESFELETAGAPGAAGEGPATIPAAPAPVVPQAPPAPAAEAEPAPIPLAKVEEESFEIETLYAAAAPPAVVETPAPAPPAATPPEPPSEAEFEFESPTLTPGILSSGVLEATFEELKAKAAPPPAPVPEPAAEAPPLATSTLAELYFNQGFTDKAIEVYRQIVEREPVNERARARLSELLALERHLRAEEQREPVEAAAPSDPRAARRAAIERSIARLEKLLAATRRG